MPANFRRIVSPGALMNAVCSVQDRTIRPPSKPKANQGGLVDCSCSKITPYLTDSSWPFNIGRLSSLPAHLAIGISLKLRRLGYAPVTQFHVPRKHGVWKIHRIGPVLRTSSSCNSERWRVRLRTDDAIYSTLVSLFLHMDTVVHLPLCQYQSRFHLHHYSN